MLCGQQLEPGGGAATNPLEVYSGDLTLTSEHGGYGWFYLQYVPDCSKGVGLVYDPPSAVQIQAQAKAGDGGIVAVMFYIKVRHFTIKVTRPDGTDSTVTIDLPADEPVIPS